MWVDPSDLPWLIDRPRMTVLLTERWQRRVVTVVTGPGFGKSTALAVAMRETTNLGDQKTARTDEKSLAAVANLRRGHLHDGWIALVEFVRCHQLLNLGRIREAHDAATRSKELGLPGFHGGWCSVYSASWHLGVTRDRIDQLPFADEVADASPVDQIWIGAWFGAMQTYAGRHDAAARNIAAAERALHARNDSQLIGFVAWARAAMAVVEHHESLAQQILRHYLKRHRITSPLGQRFAARAPAMFDLLFGDDLPAGWSAQLTGRWQHSVLWVGAALRALRSGSPVDSLPDPAWSCAPCHSPGRSSSQPVQTLQGTQMRPSWLDEFWTSAVTLCGSRSSTTFRLNFKNRPNGSSPLRVRINLEAEQCSRP